MPSMPKAEIRVNMQTSLRATARLVDVAEVAVEDGRGDRSLARVGAEGPGGGALLVGGGWSGDELGRADGVVTAARERPDHAEGGEVDADGREAPRAAVASVSEPIMSRRAATT